MAPAAAGPSQVMPFVHLKKWRQHHILSTNGAKTPTIQITVQHNSIHQLK